MSEDEKAFSFNSNLRPVLTKHRSKLLVLQFQSMMDAIERTKLLLLENEPKNDLLEIVEIVLSEAIKLIEKLRIRLNSFGGLKLPNGRIIVPKVFDQIRKDLCSVLNLLNKNDNTLAIRKIDKILMENI